MLFKTSVWGRSPHSSAVAMLRSLMEAEQRKSYVDRHTLKVPQWKHYGVSMTGFGRHLTALLAS